ncbi:hypothetical protein AAF712_009510 [Marasmius tenuissimus]|uniref:MYND-type domain-containing protein n=1 Tax=Marasmius tenuissimus TaxID=585030 RepID=A0ABR2ZQY6_9AGAR
MDKEGGYDIAQYLTDHFFSIPSQSDIDFCTLRADIALLLDIMRFFPQTDILHRMLSKGAAKAFANALVAIASQACTMDAARLTQFEFDRIHCLTALLGRCFAGGLTWACDALDCHFLIALLQMSVLPGGDDPESTELLALYTSYAKLMNLLKPYLVYRSVLNRACREMKIVRHSELVERLDERNPFRLALEDVEKEVERLKAIQREFEATNTVFNVCSVRKCWYAKPGSKIRRCSGCQVAIYCSRQCQQADWSTHKQTRHIYDNPKDGLSRRISQLDQLFPKFLIQREIRDHPVRSPAHNGSKNYRSKTRAEEIVVQFDCRVSPIRVTYTTAAKVLEDMVARSGGLDHNQTELQWAKDRMIMLKGRVRENPHGLILCYMLYPAAHQDSFVLYAEQV